MAGYYVIVYLQTHSISLQLMESEFRIITKHECFLAINELAEPMVGLANKHYFIHGLSVIACKKMKNKKDEVSQKLVNPI